MGGRHVHRARHLLEGTLDAALPEEQLVRAARAVVAELGSPERLFDLVRELATGVGAPSACALLSYRHVLGFDKLLLIDGGPGHMLRAHVWHPGTRSAGREDIHNHRSPLASYVVRGRLGMELYEPLRSTANPGESGVAASWFRESLSDVEGHWLLEPAGPARLRLTQTAEYGTGSGYGLPSYALHRAWCASAGTAVTLFLETGAGRRRYTDVFADATDATGSGGRAEAVVKRPMDVKDYLAELESLAELLSR
ncbi:hypothetical protein GCM10009837_17860 [Streptomyces durmitorensis]|uniref:Cysteine dioxygenase type I n=1 Tax=Streptomyces durmitorensis TaxID=319947 RepID=A0ABY4PQ13_9ACTN|nr:hypothetical protein [Streptomyces durmitorensis]UQT55522.1 hypothetical protein M4V62_10710 [Streptomyces durmitorensis]